MESSISLRSHQRKSLLLQVRRSSHPQQRLRAHILLLLAEGYTWNLIAAVLFTSSSTIHRWQRRFQKEGLAAVQPAAPPGHARWASWWVALVIQWVTWESPLDYGFLRSRWTCQTIVVLLRQDHGIQVGRETIRRWLHQANLVWRRPRPVLGPEDPQHQAKVRKIQALLRHLPANEVAVFQDEVDIHTNPKIGSMWMQKGQQAEVITPGTNQKRYLAGSLNWRTGTLIVTQGGQRNAELFVAHLEELRRRLRCYQRIHVLCDNAIFHRPDRCRKVAQYLQRWGHRIVLHFLPTYAPETNPIERIWWHLHEEITRDHRCPAIEDLLQLVFDWLEARSYYRIETSLYRNLKTA